MMRLLIVAWKGLDVKQRSVGVAGVHAAFVIELHDGRHFDPSSFLGKVGAAHSCAFFESLNVLG